MEDGTIRDIRIALGSIAPIVLRAVKTEDALRGATLTPEVIAAARETSGKRDFSDRRYSLDGALSHARRAKSARRISFAARPMKTIQVIRSTRVVTPEGVKAATVLMRNGRIIAVRGHDDLPAGANVYDAQESVVMPGLVDTHVHINEPGRTDWEGFETATRAAAAGGITTLIDMPLNSIPATTTAAALETKRAAARKKCWVNVGFWGGVVPGNAGELRALHRAGVFGFKCFLVPSGVPEFENVNESDLRAALPKLAAMDVPLLVHSELPGPIEEETRKLAKADPRKYKTWLRSRPPAAETKAIEMLIRLAREFKARVHIVHLSSQLSVPLIRRAKKEGLRITAETCPHYLFFASGSIRDGRTEYKCAPPIRDSRNNGKLWTALGKNAIDFVVSDHSPSPPAMKCDGHGRFLQGLGWYLFVAAWSPRHVDKAERPKLFIEASGTLDVQRSGTIGGT